MFVQVLALEQRRIVSDPQLRRLLAIVDHQEYQQFQARYFGWQINLLPPDGWINFDGKGTRGTIEVVSGQQGLCYLILLHTAV